ncbi:sigma-70 family RNA polymerase sigma factor [Saccharopolyspora gloriosae]|uniref:sigma-70 family RNA polymerase sigma factor n=1 Tax=Saccharopolyspora gloriosae TaxID=455344 RepID=UPI001FB62831|nr:sigma-70 family RNA polymerase sigma factor [Saccharopolyspora gloriosae]
MTTIDGVIDEHGAALLSYVTRITGDRYLAEDVVQETWLRAWRNIDRLENGTGSVRGWLLRVAHNVAIDLHRGRRARPAEVGIEGDELADIAVQAQHSDEVENRVVVDELLDRLSPVHRRAVIEVYFIDRTTKSAASELGVPVGTVKSRLHNALRVLREPRLAREAV